MEQPEVSRCSCQASCGGGFVLKRPLERRSDVGVVLFEPDQPFRGLSGLNMRFCFFTQFEKIASVAFGCGHLFGLFFKLLEGEFTNHLEHSKSRRIAAARDAPEETFLDQRSENVHRLTVTFPDSFGRFGIETPRKDRHSSKECSLAIVQKIVTPADRPTHGLLPLRQVAWAARKERERLDQAGGQSFRGQHARTCGREFDREREAIKPGADPSDIWKIGGI